MQLFRQIFFDMEVVLGFIASIAIFRFNIVSFPQALAAIDPTKNKSKRFSNEQYRFEQYELAIVKRTGLQFLVCLVVIISAALDGVMRIDLFGIIAWPIVLLFIPLGYWLFRHFERISKQFHISFFGFRSLAFPASVFLSGSFIASIAFTVYVLWSYIL